MNPTASACLVPPVSPEELRTLELDWYHGTLLRHVDRLFAFVDQHRAEILRRAGDDPDATRLIGATQQLIVDRGGLNMRLELQEQLAEIHRELWLRGERGEHDRERIVAEWIRHHAAAWRRWQVIETCFVAAQCAPHLAELLRHSPP